MNIGWNFIQSNKVNGEGSLLNYCNEDGNIIISIRFGVFKNNGKVIRDIRFNTNNLDEIEKLEIILENKLEESRRFILGFSVDFWKNKVLGRSKNITRIYNKTKNKKELSKGEIYILYGLYNVREKNNRDSYYRGYEMGYFGYAIDPRIPIVIKNRDHGKDFEHFTLNEKIELLNYSKNNGFKYNFVIDDKNLILKTNLLEYASDSLLTSATFIKKYIKESSICSDILKYTKGKINNNKEILLLILNTKANDDFKYASDILKNDKEVALLAVKKNGLMLEYVGDYIKNDVEIIVSAIINNEKAITYVDPNILESNPIITYIYNLVRSVNRNEQLTSFERKKQKIMINNIMENYLSKSNLDDGNISENSEQLDVKKLIKNKEK